MRKQVVAIVGRPNVGKSTLFNRLSRKRTAIIDFEPGITRDRKYEDVAWNGKKFIIIDTGGIVADSDEPMDHLIRMQAELAMDEADWILFLVDAKTGVTDLDMMIGQILGRKREKVMLVVNKVDNEKDELEIYDFMQLGFGEPFPIAANSGRNTGNFLDELLTNMPETMDDDFEEEHDNLHIAIVGKPNVGKSSITNCLLGEDQLIVSDVPGTTRDSIDSVLKYYGQEYVLVDTAGLRRKSKVKYGVEYFSSMRTIDAIDRADLVILIISADEEISNQEQRIASYVRRRFKDLIVVVNKWDLPEKDNSTLGQFVNKIKEELSFIDYAPILFVSAKTGQRISKIMEKVVEVTEESNKRIPTAQLNEFLEKIVYKHQPSHKTGKRIKIFYLTQAGVHPPTFIFFCNDATLIKDEYKRYLHNQIREEFGFVGATIKLVFKGRKEEDVSVEY
jgi:GTP-binding protein